MWTSIYLNLIVMFKNKQIEKVVANLIKEAGTYRLRVMNYAYLNSFVQDFAGTIKPEVYEKINEGTLWAKPVGQLAITLGHVADDPKNSKGVITVRFQEEGFVKPEDADFDASLLDKKDHKVIEGYVCKLNAEKHWERIPSKEKTDACDRMVFSFFNKLGYDEGSIDEVLQSAIKENAEIMGEVYIDHYEESEIPKVKKWFVARDTAELAEFQPEATEDEFAG